MIITIGVDPGKTGAWAALDDLGNILGLDDMPISPILLADQLREWAEIGADEVIAVVEQVTAMPRQRGGGKLMRNLGHIEGVCAALGFRLEGVSPATWKRDMRLTADKDLSRKRAIERWPAHSTSFSRKKDDGRAEACLIALWHVDGGAS